MASLYGSGRSQHLAGVVASSDKWQLGDGVALGGCNGEDNPLSILGKWSVLNRTSKCSKNSKQAE